MSLQVPDSCYSVSFYSLVLSCNNDRHLQPLLKLWGAHWGLCSREKILTHLLVSSMLITLWQTITQYTIRWDNSSLCIDTLYFSFFVYLSYLETLLLQIHNKKTKQNPHLFLSTVHPPWKPWNPLHVLLQRSPSASRWLHRNTRTSVRLPPWRASNNFFMTFPWARGCLPRRRGGCSKNLKSITPWSSCSTFLALSETHK